MYTIKVVYDNEKDKELLDKVVTTTPFFVEYINMNTIKGRKEGFKVMNYWSAKELPFVEIKSDKLDATPIIKYTESGGNAINQLIKFLNESSDKETRS